MILFSLLMNVVPVVFADADINYMTHEEWEKLRVLAKSDAAFQEIFIAMYGDIPRYNHSEEAFSYGKKMQHVRDTIYLEEFLTPYLYENGGPITLFGRGATYGVFEICIHPGRASLFTSEDVEMFHLVIVKYAETEGIENPAVLIVYDDGRLFWELEEIYFSPTHPETFESRKSDKNVLAVYGELPEQHDRAAEVWWRKMSDIYWPVRESEALEKYMYSNRGTVFDYNFSKDGYLQVFIASDRANQVTPQDLEEIRNVFEEQANKEYVENLPIAFVCENREKSKNKWIDNFRLKWNRFVPVLKI